MSKAKKSATIRDIGFLKGTKIWAMVAHRAGAEIFLKTSRSVPCQSVHHFLHPDGRLKDQELQSDKQGRVKDRKGKGKHAMSKEFKPTVQMALRFAKDMAKILEKARDDRKFDRLVLIAPAELLGLIQKNISKQLNQIVIATIRKDLMTMSENEIQSRVDDILCSLFPSATSPQRDSMSLSR